MNVWDQKFLLWLYWKNKSKILEVIRVPNLTKKKNGENSFYLIKKFISSPICHKLYILVLVNLYLLINFFVKSDLESLVKKKELSLPSFKIYQIPIILIKDIKKLNF